LRAPPPPLFLPQGSKSNSSHGHPPPPSIKPGAQTIGFLPPFSLSLEELRDEVSEGTSLLSPLYSRSQRRRNVGWALFPRTRKRCTERSSPPPFGSPFTAPSVGFLPSFVSPLTDADEQIETECNPSFSPPPPFSALQNRRDHAQAPSLFPREQQCARKRILTFSLFLFFLFLCFLMEDRFFFFSTGHFVIAGICPSPSFLFLLTLECAGDSSSSTCFLDWARRICFYTPVFPPFLESACRWLNGDDLRRDLPFSLSAGTQ